MKVTIREIQYGDMSLIVTSQAANNSNAEGLTGGTEMLLLDTITDFLRAHVPDRKRSLKIRRTRAR